MCSCTSEVWSFGPSRNDRFLSNDIGRDLVFDESDAVAQLQLALLQPLQPQQIRRGRLMQGIDRRVEIAVLLLQPCELGFEFALIFVGHGVRWLETRMRLRKVMEAAEGISSLPARSASRPGPGFRTHDSLHMIPNYESAIFDTHRQIR